MYSTAMTSKFEIQDPSSHLETLKKNIVQNSLLVRALIQDILGCRTSLSLLNELNEMGRSKLAELRTNIENLELYARDTADKKLMTEVESHRQQLTSTLKAFKEANFASLFAIEKAQREELHKKTNDEDENTLRNRKKTDKSGLLKMSTGVTDQLLSISRQLADTTQRSQDTLDSLVTTSSTVKGTQDELQNTAGTISQSGKLLKKYGRREFTDKIIMFLAFLFFIACVFYIIQKRLF